MVVNDTVLIIDDEPDSCLLWTTFLTQMHYKVYTALTLAEGIKLAESVKPYIIFLDNNLPDGLGWEHADTIQSAHPGCKIYLVSAHGSEDDPARFGDKTILYKPLTLSSIRALL
jgi:two-component system, OmpR family, response regulator